MAEAIGLLVECRDEPGVLHRITEVILRHNANIGYVAGGARGGPVAEIQLEVSGAFDLDRLTSELEAVPGVTKVTAVPTFQAIYGKRVIVIGGGAQVGMVAQGAISEADRHNIRGERISVDTIPLVGEEQLAEAADTQRAVADRRVALIGVGRMERDGSAAEFHDPTGPDDWPVEIRCARAALTDRLGRKNCRRVRERHVGAAAEKERSGSANIERAIDRLIDARG